MGQISRGSKEAALGDLYCNEKGCEKKAKLAFLIRAPPIEVGKNRARARAGPTAHHMLRINIDAMSVYKYKHFCVV